jgi:hypothetical protein
LSPDSSSIGVSSNPTAYPPACAWTRPAIANDKLYLRDQGRLYYFDLKKSGS